MFKYKKIYISSACILMAFCFLLSLIFYNNSITVFANFDDNINYRAAVLIERNSGKILVEDNAHNKHPIASVTKLMTILLTLEHVDNDIISLNDDVLVSENAHSMGGSQIFLDANVKYKLEDLLKSVIVCSANDSSVAIAEHIAGSENNFVRLMNEKARELNLQNTNYVNCTGLPSVEGYSSAYDQAVILNKVLNYDAYHTYSSIWFEDFTHPSGRTTQMTNTNKLSRFYSGCIGGKTGSTNQAKFCLAVGAERNDMQLISVVLGVENSKDRFKLSSDLLNYGFDNYSAKTLFSNADLQGKTISIKGGDRTATLKAERDYTIVTNKTEEVNYSLNFNLPNQLTSVSENQIVGNVEIIINGIVEDTINILSCASYEEATVWDFFKEIIKEQ